MKHFLLSTALVFFPGYLLHVEGLAREYESGQGQAPARERDPGLTRRLDGSRILPVLLAAAPTAPATARAERDPHRYGVDWSFVAELEGKSRQKAYVPARKRSGQPLGRSGVTVGTGFDLGQHAEVDLRRMGISGTLLTKLRPYLRLRKGRAQAFLKRFPLVLTVAEARELDQAKRRDLARRIEQAFDRERATHVSPFARLDPAQQTVIVSLAMQYGTHLRRSAPNFWISVLEGRFGDAVRELRSFGDAYPTRRSREAGLLASAAG